MTSHSSVVPLRQPDEIDDPLTAVLRSGARRLLAQAVEVEAEAFLASMKGVHLPNGRERLVRHGLGPERVIQTGIGPVEVQRVKLRDRGAGADGERIRFTSAILPRWARRTRSLDTLLPVLYLRGVSMGDFQDALTALLGKDAPNLSPQVRPQLGRTAVIARLRDEWQADYARWQRRDLAARRYVYVWADGVYLQARMEPQAECMLVLIGATPEGKKELVGFQVGVRESAQHRAHGAMGASCWSTSRRGVSPSRPSWPQEMEHLASGRRWRRCFPRPSTNDAGFTKPRTS